MENRTTTTNPELVHEHRCSDCGKIILCDNSTCAAAAWQIDICAECVAKMEEKMEKEEEEESPLKIPIEFAPPQNWRWERKNGMWNISENLR